MSHKRFSLQICKLDILHYSASFTLLCSFVNVSDSGWSTNNANFSYNMCKELTISVWHILLANRGKLYVQPCTLRRDPSGLRLETGQDKALKGAGKEYVCIFGILGVWI